MISQIKPLQKNPTKITKPSSTTAAHNLLYTYMRVSSHVRLMSHESWSQTVSASLSPDCGSTASASPLLLLSHKHSTHERALTHARTHARSYRVTPFLRNAQQSLAIKLICGCDLQSCQDGQQAHWGGAGSCQLSLGCCLFMDKQSLIDWKQIDCTFKKCKKGVGAGKGSFFFFFLNLQPWIDLPTSWVRLKIDKLFEVESNCQIN